MPSVSIKGRNKPWLTIAQSPICDLFSADADRLSDEATQLENGLAQVLWKMKGLEDSESIGNPPKTGFTRTWKG